MTSTNGMRWLDLLSLTVLAIVVPTAWAHKPTFPDGTGCDQAGAITIEDINVSQVAYTELTEACPQLWLTFDAQAGQELYLQIALPQIDRYKDLRPSVAILGPGLPDRRLPADRPDRRPPAPAAAPAHQPAVDMVPLSPSRSLLPWLVPR